MARRVTLGLLGDSESGERILRLDENARASELRQIISEATGVAPEKVKLVAPKGVAMTSLGDGERVPKSVRVGGVSSLSTVGEEKAAAPKEEEVDPRGREQDSLAPLATPLRAPPPREPRQPRPAEPAKPKAVSKEEAAAKAAARKAREAARAGGKEPGAVPAAPVAVASSGYPKAALAPKAAAPPPKAASAPPAAATAVAAGLPLERALQLQKDLMDAFSMEEFQDGLGKLHWDTLGMKVTERRKQYQDYLLQVQKEVLPKYGFQGSSRGVFDMLGAFASLGYNDDPVVDSNTNTLNDLLSLERAGLALRDKVAWAQAAEHQAAEHQVAEPQALAVPAQTEAPKPPAQVGPVAPSPAYMEELLASGWTAPSKEQLCAMQRDLIAGYNEVAFQRKLRTLPEGPAGQQAKADLLWTVQGPIIAKYGFHPTPEGLWLSSNVFTRELNLDPEVAANNEALFVALDPRMQELRAKRERELAEKAARERRSIELSLVGSKDKPCTMQVDLDAKVGLVRKLVGEATCTDVSKVELLWKKSGTTAPPVKLDDNVKCPSSVQVKGCEHFAPGGGVLLPRHLALAMQRELRDRYKAEAFQRRLSKLADVASPEKQRQLMRDLCFEEQQLVLPRYGFRNSRDGVLGMLLSFTLVQRDMVQRQDEEMITLNVEFNALLDMAGAQARTAEAAALEEAAEEAQIEESAPAEEPVVEEVQPPQPPVQPAVAWMNAMLMGMSMEDLEDEEQEEEAEEEQQQDTGQLPELAAPAAGAPAPEEPPAEDPAAKRVKLHGLEVRLLDDAKASPSVLMVPSKTTGAAVRQGISEATGTKLAEVKLFRNANDVLIAVADTERVQHGPVMVRGPQQFPRGGVLLDRATALQFQKDLRDKFAAPEFQAKLAAFNASNAQASAMARGKAQRDLAFSEQKDLLPRYGFQATADGQANMIVFFMTAYLQDEEIVRTSNEANALFGSAQPPPAPQAARPAAVVRWTVVGGGDKGGIIVRQSADLASPQLGRLSTGAIVRQQKLEGDRLHYEKASGTGPDSGWVSLTFRNSELLRQL